MITYELKRKKIKSLYDCLEKVCISVTTNNNIEDSHIVEHLKMYLVKNIENHFKRKIEIGYDYIEATNSEEEEICLLLGAMEKLLKSNKYDDTTWDYTAPIEVYLDVPQSAWAYHPDAQEPLLYEPREEVRDVTAADAWRVLLGYPGEIVVDYKNGMASINVPKNTLGLLFTHIKMCRKD